ncbi:unnamed protein product, partial [Laminaria digitata]
PILARKQVHFPSTPKGFILANVAVMSPWSICVSNESKSSSTVVDLEMPASMVGETCPNQSSIARVKVKPAVVRRSDCMALSTHLRGGHPTHGTTHEKATRRIVIVAASYYRASFGAATAELAVGFK